MRIPLLIYMKNQAYEDSYEICQIIGDTAENYLINICQQLYNIIDILYTILLIDKKIW